MPQLRLETIDDAQQAAANLQEEDVWNFAKSVILAHFCKEKGDAALEAIAPYRKWSAQTLNRLAALYPIYKQWPSLLDPDVALGCYWHLLNNCKTRSGDFSPYRFRLWVKRCQRDGLSLGKLKELRGEKRERETQEPWYEGEAWGMYDGDGHISIANTVIQDREAAQLIGHNWIRIHVTAVEVEDGGDSG